MNRDQIKEIFLSSGFSIKEGHTDLKDYVYQAALNLMVAAANAAAESRIQLSHFSCLVNHYDHVEEKRLPGQFPVYVNLKDQRMRSVLQSYINVALIEGRRVHLPASFAKHMGEVPQSFISSLSFPASVLQPTDSVHPMDEDLALRFGDDDAFIPVPIWSLLHDVKREIDNRTEAKGAPLDVFDVHHLQQGVFNAWSANRVSKHAHKRGEKNPYADLSVAYGTAGAEERLCIALTYWGDEFQVYADGKMGLPRRYVEFFDRDEKQA